MIQWDKIDPGAWANAVLLLIGGLLAHFGIGQVRRARQVPEAQSEIVEVAGAIVSDKAVDRMIKSLDEFSAAATLLKAAIDRDVEAKGKLTAAMVENSRQLGRNSDVSEEMHEQVKDTGTRLDRLKEELIRTSAHR